MNMNHIKYFFQMTTLLNFFGFFFFLLFSTISSADVLKPALVEITFFDNNKIQLELDLSLEAAMSDISTSVKNTKGSPNEDIYNDLRKLEPEELKSKFIPFENEFRKEFKVLINGQETPLVLTETNISNIGYKKRPRKTILTYTGHLQEWPETLQWQYSDKYGDNAVRYQIFKKDTYNWSRWQWLRNGKASEVIQLDNPKPETFLERSIQFMKIGFDHVIPLGWDHILFIIGMALSSLVIRNLLILVSTFTIAHTITLGMATAGFVEIPGYIVEPLIAFSIAYVAVENLFGKIAVLRKSIIVFFFGLIHGLGFASMLKEFDMEPDNFLNTLISFNIGVELAQILIVLFVFSILTIFSKYDLNYKKYIIIPSSIIISLIGIYWGIERIVGA